MDEIVRAIILGLVQGVTEFLPISSSGHLMLFPWLFGWEEHPLSFDVALHVGTLVAVVAYYFKDFWRIGLAFMAGIREREFRGHPDRVLAVLVIVGTIPAALAGVLFESQVESINDSPAVIGAFLLLTGVFLVAAHVLQGSRAVESMTGRDALVIGAAQALALIPGVSRAGTTIVAGMFRGLRPEESARYSFLLSVPIIAGAGAVQALDLGREAGDGMGWGAIAAGVVTAAVSAFVAIHYLIKLLAGQRISVFAYYCFAMGGFVLLLAWLR